MKLYRTCLFLVLMTLVATLEATVYEADFTGSAPSLNTPWQSASTLDSHLANGGWTLGSGVKTTGVRDDVLDTVLDNWPDDGRSTLTQAIAKDQYISLTLEADAGWQLDLNDATVTFTIDREDFWAAQQFTVFTSVDGFSEAAAVYAGAEPWGNTQDPFALSFTLPASGYDGLTGPLEIRIYFWSGTYSKLCGMTAFALDGEVTPIQTKGTLIQL